MIEDTGTGDKLAEQPSAATEQSALPENFQTEGEGIIEHLQRIIEGRPVLTVASALTATLFAAVTQKSLDRPAREALTVMVHDLLHSVMAENEISEERLEVIMAQRGDQTVLASEIGAIVLDGAIEVETDQEQD